MVLTLIVDSVKNVLKFIHDVIGKVMSGESPTVSQALRDIGRDRKSMSRFLYIYYLSAINPQLFDEVCRQICDSRRFGVFLGFSIIASPTAMFDIVTVDIVERGAELKFPFKLYRTCRNSD